MNALRNACAALLLAASSLGAQGVIVSPPVLIVEHRTRTAALDLFNPGDRPIEVRVELLFGYPVTDSVGEFHLETPDPIPANLPAATKWLEAYPARATIPPGGRQTVRFLASPPATLADGEYWTRLAITSKFAPSRQDAKADTTRVSTQLNVEIRAITTLLYRKGAVNTSIAIGDIKARRLGDSLEVRASLEHAGNAAYLGTITYALEDMTGRVVRSVDLPIGIYLPINPRILIPVNGLNPGPYRVSITARAERKDLLAESILAVPERTVRFDVVLTSR
jgi:P pilus assembly chaperone PapD